MTRREDVDVEPALGSVGDNPDYTEAVAYLIDQRNPEMPLPSATDPAILRIIRALARQAAQDDHARESRG
jgi:hypothetical protein